MITNISYKIIATTVNLLRDCFILAAIPMLNKEPEKTNAEILLQHIQEKNTDAVYDMLCRRLQETPGVREQIRQTFDIIVGDVVSYKTGYGSTNGQWSYGKEKMTIFRSCKEITTTASDSTYQLLIMCYDRNDFETELKGINKISLFEKKPCEEKFIKRFEFGLD